MTHEKHLPTAMIPASIGDDAYNQWFGIAKQIVSNIKENFKTLPSRDPIDCRTYYISCWVGDKKREIPSLIIPKHHLSSVFEDKIKWLNEIFENATKSEILTKNVAIIETPYFYHCIPVMTMDDNVLEKPLFIGSGVAH